MEGTQRDDFRGGGNFTASAPGRRKRYLRHWYYLGQLKNENFALSKHVKHVSNVSLYNLSNTYMSNITKISAKCHNVQNVNIALFVHSLSLASLKLFS